MKKIIKRESVVLIIMFLIVAYFVSRSVPNLMTITAKSIYPIEEEVQDKFKKKAIVIKNEEIYKSESKGVINYLVSDGDKIPSGTTVAQLKNSDNIFYKNQELYDLNKKINILRDSKNNIEKNTMDIDSIDGIVEEIQENLYNKDYKNAETSKEKLNLYNNVKETTKGIQILDDDLKKMENEKNKLEQEISSNILNYISKNSGIVSYKLDGYENKYKYSDRGKYKFKNLEIKKDKDLKEKVKVEHNDPLFKIINNLEWYLLIDGKRVRDIQDYNIGNNIFIEIEGKSLTGKIEKIIKDGNDISLLCRFNTNFEDIYDKRFIDIDIVRYTYKGYKIPNEALIEKGDKYGVIIKDLGGVTKFRPINILYKNSKYTYIDIGDQNGYIQIPGYKKAYRTVRKFDEILVNPLRIKEGLILN